MRLYFHLIYSATILGSTFSTTAYLISLFHLRVFLFAPPQEGLPKHSSATLRTDFLKFIHSVSMSRFIRQTLKFYTLHKKYEKSLIVRAVSEKMCSMKCAGRASVQFYKHKKKIPQTIHYTPPISQ